MKLKRLEERVGQKLIERTPRLVRLSAQGAVFLASARDFLAAHDRAVAGLTSARRRFSVGIAAHVGGAEVPTLLARLHALDPALTIQVRLDNSRDRLDDFDRGELTLRSSAGRTTAATAKSWRRSISVGTPHRALSTAQASRCDWLRRLHPAASGTSPRARLMLREYLGPRSSWVVAPSPFRRGGGRLGHCRLLSPTCPAWHSRDQPGVWTSSSAFLRDRAAVALSDAKSREALRALVAAFREHRAPNS